MLKSVKNLALALCCRLTVNAHASNTAPTCYFELRCLASIRGFMASTANATLVCSFVLSRIDYCYSLLSDSSLDVTCHLQQILNYSAHVILRVPKSANITAHLISLPWPTVKARSTYNISCLCYHFHNSTAPSYATDMWQKKPTHSHTTPLLNRPAQSKVALNKRSFSFV